MNFSRALRQPYPLFTFSEAMKRDLFFGFFLTLFLLVFTPFGLDVFAYDRFYIILGYGLVTYATITLNDVVGYTLAPKIFSEPHWNVTNQIVWMIWHLLMLGVTNLMYGFLVGAFPLTLLSFLKLELYVFASAIIPVMGITILRQNYLLRQNRHQADGINQDIREKEFRPAPDSQRLRFTADNNKDYLEEHPSSIISIRSQDNYVEFVVKKEDKIQKELLRSTLGRIEEFLAGNGDFFRCHRAFIVNLGKVKSVEGNSQGYRLIMEDMSEPIPVARPRNKALRDIMHSLNVHEMPSPP